MAFLTYPLNYIDYDHEDAETWLATRSSGVFVKTDFAYSVTGADNNITFGEGLAWIHNHKFAGKVFRNDGDFVVDFGVSDAIYDRIDVAAIQFDKVANTTNIVAKSGIAQTNPVIPVISQTEELYELYICSVYRKAGSAYITNADITDLRLSPQYCGLMADSVTSIDTEAINAQVMALIRRLENEISGIAENTATMLKSVYDTDNDGIVNSADNGVFVYEQNGTSLEGQGKNGAVKSTASGVYTYFTIDGETYNVKSADENEIELTNGAWYSFILDEQDKTINFKRGGGLNNSKLLLATATEKDVSEGKTFYSGNKEIKTGTRKIGQIIDANAANYPAASGEEFTVTLEIPETYSACIVNVSMYGIMTTGTYISVRTSNGSITQLDERDHRFTAGSYGGQHINSIWLVENISGGATISVIGGGGGRHDLSCFAVSV